MAETYDQRCWDLADYFLRDEPSRSHDPQLYKSYADKLALVIQAEVEQWLQFDDDAPANAGKEVR